MAYDIGPKIGIEGEAEFRKQINLLTAQQRTLASELKAVTSAFDENDKSEEKAAAQANILTKQIETQKQKLDALKQGLAAAAEKYGENDRVTLGWKQAVNKATTELNNMQRELSESTSASAKLAEEQEKLAKQVSETSDKLQKSSEAVQAVNKAAIAGAAAVGGIAVAAGKVGSDFEAQMSKVQAISGATSDELETLKDAAKEMGATTKFSATESAQALEYMAMAGWKTQQMTEGLPGIINLAAASGEDLATVSDIVTDAITAFGLKASDSAHFADVLAKASSSANTNVSMLGETFKYAAPVAGALGYSVEDTAVAIGLMANAGIKGTNAGTALRSMLTNLAKPSDDVAQYMADLNLSITDASGNVKPLNQLLEEMRQKFAGLTESQKAEYAAGIAGKEAMSGLLAIINSSDDDFNNLTTAINNSNGSAKKMADTMNNNLQGQLTLLKSAAESVGIAFYEKFSGQATGAVQSLADSVGNFAKQLSSGALDSKLSTIATAAATATAAIVALNVVMAVKDVANFAKAVKAGKLALEGYTAATKAGTIAQAAYNLVASMSPLGWLVIGLTAVTAAVVTLWHTNEGFRNAVITTLNTIQQNLQPMIESIRNFLSITLPNALNMVTSNIQAFSGKLTELKDNVISGVISSLNSFKTTIENNSTTIKTAAIIIGTIFGPALVKSGVQAVVSGGQIAASFTANLVKSGVEAVISGAKITASFISTMIKSGAAAVVNGAKITSSFIASMAQAGISATVNGAKIVGSFVASMVQTAAQAVVTGAAITKNLIAAVVAYAAQGWKTAASIAAQTTALVAQKAALVAASVATKAVTAAQWLLNAAMNANPISLLIAAIGALVAAFVVLWNKCEAFRNFWIELCDGIVSAFKSAVNFIIKGINTLIRGLNKIHFSIPDWVPSIGGKSFGIHISEIPLLAKGGIVDKATLAMIGESGKEAVLPLEHNTGWIKTLADEIATSINNITIQNNFTSTPQMQQSPTIKYTAIYNSPSAPMPSDINRMNRKHAQQLALIMRRNHV